MSPFTFSKMNAFGRKLAHGAHRFGKHIALVQMSALFLRRRTAGGWPSGDDDHVFEVAIVEFPHVTFVERPAPPAGADDDAGSRGMSRTRRDPDSITAAW